jgi:spermidine/putrescine transport system ATP-binding protein
MTMSDRIAVMSRGKVQQMGTPVEIYERPANRFVADFIGESNFLEGRIKSMSANETCVYIPEWDEEIYGIPVSEGLVNGEEVIVSIRPEKIHITEKPYNIDTLTGQVVNTVYIGTDTHVYIDVKGKTLKVFEQNRISRLDPGSYYTVGQQVTFVMLPENVLVLKKD